MSVSQVVIVGRPNVGKSSLFNWLAGRRLSIVDDQPGVTRDRVTQLIEVEGRYFELVDTGGMGIEDVDNLTQQIEEQINMAIDLADVILFVVDTREGIMPLDHEVARRMRFVDKPVLLVANKTDDPKFDPQADEFYKLGRGKLVKISVQQQRNKSELLECILERLPPAAATDAAAAEPVMKVAIVGRRNTGKSTFVNTLAQAERMIVSEVPGTTRDSVDVRYELDGKTFMAIDTPGLRRGRSVRTDIDFYSFHRAQRSIRRADVVLMFFDAAERISKVDKTLCKYVADQYKPCVFVVNKWDLLKDTMPTEKWVHYLRDTFPSMLHVPIAFITGQTGKNVKALLNHAQMLYRQNRMRVSTGELNRLLRKAVEVNQPPLFQGKQPKLFYATQLGVEPPTLLLLCNQPSAFSPQYQRYLLSVLRDHLEFGEVPIKLYLNRRGDRDARGTSGDEASAETVPANNSPDDLADDSHLDHVDLDDVALNDDDPS